MSADPRRAKAFLLAAVVWSIGLFALFRAPVVERGLVVPLTRMQEQAAALYAGAPAAPIAVTLECSGTDVLALCLAAILACPVSRRSRLAGALGAVAFVLALNTVRIATLGLAAASPALFLTLHRQVWPAILVLAAAGYVFAWMRMTLDAASPDAAGRAPFPLARFAPRAALLLVAFALAGPWLVENEGLAAAGRWVAGAAALILASAGLAATASGNVLATSRGAFVVTPECLATALVPLYLAGVLTVRRTWRWRALALAAAAPLFAALAVARLLLLALPPSLAASPLFLVHGFHQLVLAIAAVAIAALWREPEGPDRLARGSRQAAVALGAASILAVVAGGVLTRGVVALAGAIAGLAGHSLTGLTNPGDAQGAFAILPAYQAAFLLALAIATRAGWGRAAAASAILLGTQVAFLVLLGEVADHAGLVAHALALRAWAVAVPLLLTPWMLRAAPGADGTLVPLRPAADGLR